MHNICGIMDWEVWVESRQSRRPLWKSLPHGSLPGVETLRSWFFAMFWPCFDHDTCTMSLRGVIFFALAMVIQPLLVVNINNILYVTICTYVPSSKLLHLEFQKLCIEHVPKGKQFCISMYYQRNPQMGMFPLGKGTAGTATILLPTGIILQLLTVKIIRCYFPMWKTSTLWLWLT